MTEISYLVGMNVGARQELLTEKMAANTHCSVLHLVPTRGRVMELEADPAFWLRRKVDTLTSVTHQIFEDHIRYRQFKDCMYIDDALRSLLVRKVLERRGAEPDGLSYFSRLSHSDVQDGYPGIYRIIAGFFSQLVRNNFQDSFVQELEGKIIRLEQETPGAGERKYALESDLTWLFGDYEEIKREICGYDEDDIMSSASLFLKDGNIPRMLVDTDVIVLDGFMNLSRVEEDILFYLFSSSKEVWWLLDYDSTAVDPIREFQLSCGREEPLYWQGREKGREGFSGQHEAYRISYSLVSLMDRSEDAGFDSNLERAKEVSFLNPAAKGLYIKGQLGGIDSSSLKVRRFGNRVQEVRSIASEIKLIIHEEGLDSSCDLGKIRIVFPDLHDYSSLIAEVFKEYGLPFSLTSGLQLPFHPLSNIFIHIFEIPLNRFQREDIFCLFSSSSVKYITTEETDPAFRIREEHLLKGDELSEVEILINEAPEKSCPDSFDIFLFDQVARRCGLNNLGGDLSEWLSPVRNFYQEVCRNVRSEEKREEQRLEYYAFIYQAGMLQEILDLFKGLVGPGSSKDIMDQIFQILEMMGLPENIVEPEESLADIGSDTKRVMKRRDIKAYTMLNDLLLASAREVKVAVDLFGIREGHNLLAELYAAFRRRLNSAYLLDERNPNVIRVSQWLETRGRSFDYIFAGRDVRDFIMPESPNRMFRIMDSIDQSKYLFSHLLRNYNKRLYLSWPEYSSEKEVQPSQALVDLELMMKSHFPADSGPGSLESLFRWEDATYLTSGREMLDANIRKEVDDVEITSVLKQIIPMKGSLESLVRGINAIDSRRSVDGLTEYDGIVEKAGMFSSFLNERNMIMSPSQLDSLANCPMQYLFARIYGLGIIDEPDVEVSPVDWGSHLHGILKTFFDILRKRGKSVADLGLGRAFSLARKVVEDYFTGAPLLERFEYFESQKREFLDGLDSEEREGVFARVLRFEEMALGGRVPAGIEYGFGFGDDNPVFLGKTRLRGVIDRFDVAKDDKNAAYIYDYKTGATPSPGMIKRGLSFQLPGYIKGLNTCLDVKMVSAVYYSLRRDVLLKESPLKSDVTDHGARGLDISHMTLIDEFADQLMLLLEKGRFHHSTDEANCRYCDFKYACYKDSRRMDHLLDSGSDHQVYSGKKNLESWEIGDRVRQGWKKVLESMVKIPSMKRPKDIRKRLDSIMDFKSELLGKRVSLPFDEKYIDDLISRMDEFMVKYEEGV